jgi:hypothetical protein
MHDANFSEVKIILIALDLLHLPYYVDKENLADVLSLIFNSDG